MGKITLAFQSNFPPYFHPQVYLSLIQQAGEIVVSKVTTRLYSIYTLIEVEDEYFLFGHTRSIDRERERE